MSDLQNEARQPYERDQGSLLLDAARLYRHNPVRWWRVLLPVLLMSLTASVGAVGRSMLLRASMSDEPSLFGLGDQAIGLGGLAVIALSVLNFVAPAVPFVTMLGLVALILSQHSAAVGGDLSPRTAWKAALRQLVPLALLTVTLMIASAVLFGLPIIASPEAGPDLKLGRQITLFRWSLFGLALLGPVVASRAGFAPLLVVLENRGFADSIRESVARTRDAPRLGLVGYWVIILVPTLIGAALATAIPASQYNVQTADLPLMVIGRLAWPMVDWLYAPFATALIVLLAKRYLAAPRLSGTPAPRARPTRRLRRSSRRS